MPPPIVPAPRRRTVSIGEDRRVLGDVGDLARLRARRRTRSAGRPTAGRVTSSLNSLRSTFRPSSNGRLTAASTRWMLYSGRQEPAELPGVGRAEVGEQSRRRPSPLRPCRRGRGPSQRHAARRRACSAKATAPARASDALARRARRPGPSSSASSAGDVVAGGHHLERHRHADEARQPLRAAGAGQQPEVDLRQPELRPTARPRGSGAHSATSRPPPSAVPWIAAITGFGRILHHRLDVEQAGALRRPAELGDVGAGDERATVADHDDRLGAVGDGPR